MTCTRKIYRGRALDTRCTRVAKYRDADGNPICGVCRGADQRVANRIAREETAAAARNERDQRLKKRVNALLAPLGITADIHCVDNKIYVTVSELERILPLVEKKEGTK